MAANSAGAALPYESLTSTSGRALIPCSLRVLLVDDSEFQRLVACALLARWGILPDIASDGVEAVRLAGESDFDIVLMDVEMPVMDGLAATACIRQLERERGLGAGVPVVAYTAGGLAANEARWRECGMDAVLQKPSDAFAMGECLHRWCGDKFPAAQH